MEVAQQYQQQHKYPQMQGPQGMQNPEMSGPGGYRPQKKPGERIEFLNLPYTFTKQDLIGMVDKYEGFIEAWMSGAKGFASFETREMADACIKSLGTSVISDHEIILRNYVPFVNNWQNQNFYPQDGGYNQGPRMMFPGDQNNNNMGFKYYPRYRQMGDEDFRQKREPYSQPKPYRYETGNNGFMAGNENNYDGGNVGRPAMPPMQQGIGPGPRQFYPRYPRQPWDNGRNNMGGGGYGTSPGPMRQGSYSPQNNGGNYNQGYPSGRNQGSAGNDDGGQNSGYNNRSSNDNKTNNDSW